MKALKSDLAKRVLQDRQDLSEGYWMGSDGVWYEVRKVSTVPGWPVPSPIGCFWVEIIVAIICALLLLYFCLV